MANETKKQKASLSLWKVLVKKWLIIVISVAVCLVASVIYSFISIKPVYTASTSIVLKMAISDNVNASTNINNATLAKKNLPTVKECLMSTKVATASNEYFNTQNQTEGNNVNKASIVVSYDESSMIFKLGYVDENKEFATKKLTAIIESAPLILANEIEAESVDLVPVQNVYDVDVSDNKVTTILVGTLLGLGLGIGIALLVYVLDNKVRTVEDLEELTGAGVIAQIDNYNK